MVTIKTAQEFKEIVKKEKVIVEFYADWCTPCKMLGMIIEEIEAENSNISIVKVDVDRFRTLAKEYRVLSVPVIKIFENGKEKNEKQGLMRKDELLDFINQ